MNKRITECSPVPTLDDLVRRLARETAIAVLLDYDGTLVPIVQHPDLAAPDTELLLLVDRLAARANTSVEIVTGRPRDVAQRWFGHLQIGLWAEHGFWYRGRSETTWVAARTPPPNWTDGVTQILEDFSTRTPGSFIEMKSASVAWHYRLAEAALGARHAQDVKRLLTARLADQPFVVLEGDKVIEVRLRGVSKALAAERILTTTVSAGGILAIGDDDTDEDLFTALPEASATVVVGNRASSAKYRVAGHDAVRRLLSELAAA